MPGYDIIGVPGSWESTDALHCRVKGIPDLNMLQLFHNPLRDTVESFINLGYMIDTEVDDLSEAGIIDGSVKVFWQTEAEFEYDSTELYLSLIMKIKNIHWLFASTITWISDKVFYSSSDSSGRKKSIR